MASFTETHDKLTTKVGSHDTICMAGFFVFLQTHCDFDSDEVRVIKYHRQQLASCNSSLSIVRMQFFQACYLILSAKLS